MEGPLKRIGQYDCYSILGQGQFGKVYKGINREEGETVAIKEISLSHPKMKIELLQRELDIMLQVYNPYLVQLKGFTRTQNNLYLVMEYCAGGDLKSKMKTLGAALGQYAQKWFKMLIDGYAELKKHNILHRDMKPENIYLSSEDLETCTLMIGDFGLSRATDFGLAGTLVGTPLYSAPELFSLSPNTNYDYKIDIWSLGIMLYEMTIGQNPFQCDNVPELCRLQLQGPRFPHGYPDVVRNLIEGMLQNNAQMRYSFEDVLANEFCRVPDTSSTSQQQMCMAQDLISLSSQFESMGEIFLAFTLNDHANNRINQIRNEALQVNNTRLIDWTSQQGNISSHRYTYLCNILDSAMQNDNRIAQQKQPAGDMKLDGQFLLQQSQIYISDNLDREKQRQGYLLAMIAQEEDKRYINSIEMDKANKKYMELILESSLVL